MKKGLFSYNMVQRSIKKPMKPEKDMLHGFKENYECASIPLRDGGAIVASAQSSVLYPYMPVSLIFHRACAQIYAQNAALAMVNAYIIMPEAAEEAAAAEIVTQLKALCKEQAVSLGQVTCRADSVENIIINIQAAGISKNNPGINAAMPGDTLIAAGHAGMAGTGIIAKLNYEELTTRYTPGFINNAVQFNNELSIKRISEVLSDERGQSLCSQVYPVSEGGFLAALWNFADGCGLGFEADLKKIPIRQESVEICEFYEINPYQLMSDGAVLIAAKNPQEVLHRLASEGILAESIGILNADKARKLIRGDEVRYLDKPAQDEIYRIY